MEDTRANPRNSCDFRREALGVSPNVLRDAQEPLLLTGLEPKSWRAAAQTWGERGEAFVVVYGDHRLGLGLARDTDMLSVREYFHESRKAYIQNSQLFTALEIQPSIFDTLAKELPPSEVPKVLENWRARPIMSVGRASTGSLAHRHDAAWFLLSHGRKRWYVGDGARHSWQSFTNQSACDWTTPQLAPLGFWRCDQQAGEVVFLPAGWWHATCNLEEFTMGQGGQGDTNNWTNLALATILNDPVRVRSAGTGEHAEPLEVSAPGGGTALHLAARNARVAALEELLWLRANIEARDSEGLTPLLTAASRGHAAALSSLLAFGAEACVVGLDGRAASHWLAGMGAEDALDVLEENGQLELQLHAQDASGVQPIHMASVNGHIPAMQLLLKRRADVNARDLSGRTALDLILELSALRVQSRRATYSSGA